MSKSYSVKLLRLPEVEARTGTKKSFIYQEIKDGRFPAPVELGKRARAWRSDEVQAWIDNRPRAM